VTSGSVREQLRAVTALIPRPRTGEQPPPSRAVGAFAPAFLAGLVRRSKQLREPRPPRWRRVSDVGNRWRSRPLLAAALRVLVVLIPALCSLGATGLLAAGVPNPSSLPVRLLWWAVLLAVSTAVALVTERQTRRLLPLALLYKLTLLFPDEAPSRYRMARAAANPQRLQELAAGSTPRSRAATHVLAWVSQLSKHDRHTRGHSERVRVFTDLLAEQMGITGIDRDKLRWAALLHDIGKLRVPAGVLNKAGTPTATEWDVLREHPASGIALVGPLAEWLGSWAGGIADHHERYDGTGYPSGLAGSAISLSGRIVAVADAYETMTAARAYKKAMQAALARQELARCAGSHFDPVVVRAFLAIGLPRMVLGIGPLSFLLHLPYLSRLPEAGLGLASMAGQAATPVAAGLTAASMATAVVVAPAAQLATTAITMHTTTSAPTTTTAAGRAVAAPTSALVQALQQSPVVRAAASSRGTGRSTSTTGTPKRSTPAPTTTKATPSKTTPGKSSPPKTTSPTSPAKTTGNPKKTGSGGTTSASPTPTKSTGSSGSGSSGSGSGGSGSGSNGSGSGGTGSGTSGSGGSSGGSSTGTTKGGGKTTTKGGSNSGTPKKSTTTVTTTGSGSKATVSPG
jgi:putative nucleotidyltransferase with HDIG domain